MADVESNIRIGIDSAAALSALKNLQREISSFQTAMAKGSATQAAQAKLLQQDLLNSINASGKFSANIKTVRTTTESFTNALEKNKLSMGEYFRFAAGASKTFGKNFATEFDTINKVARERVKDLQTQYIRLGRDANGAMQAIAVRPLVLDMENLETKTAIAAQRQQLFNQLLKQGSTNLLNFGKNTQWAGRQLMVGFSIPLAYVGATAAKAFMDMEEQAIKFKKVYGDLFTPTEERNKALADIQELGRSFTQYGIAVSDTVGLAAEAAAAGFAGVDLQRQTVAATRLSVLGQLEQQKALETTISLQNSFRMSSEDLAESIDFLNAVENQTVVSLDDITTAIPKVAPVIQQLGGNVKDLAFFLAAMKEGGVNASEGANALKSGLASLINPTDKASKMLMGMGININKIVESNQGNLKQTVVEFAQALNELDPLERSRAIEQMFGKFQFARLSTLFDNVTRQGNQASRVMDLASASASDLAQMSESELGMTANSAMNKFRKSIEDLRAELVPIGETFLKSVTPIIDFAAKLLNSFNSLDERVKSFVVNFVAILGGLGPVAIMTFGLLANGIANIIKGFAFVRNVFTGAGKSSTILGEQIDYMTQEQLQAASVAASLDQIHNKLRQTFTAEAGAVDVLTNAYSRGIAAQARFMGQPIATTVGKTGKANPKKMATGGFVEGPGSGTSDSVPAMLSNGEFVVPAKEAKEYGPLLQAIISGEGIQKFAKGGMVGTKGGQEFYVSNQNSQRAIQRLVNDLSDADDMIAQAFMNLAKTGVDTKDAFINEMKKLAAEAKVKLPASFSTEGRASASKQGEKRTVKQQLLDDFGQEGLDEYAQAERHAAKIREYMVAANEAAKAAGQELRYTAEDISDATQIDRAHIVKVDKNKMGKAGWDTKLWEAQVGAENRFSQILQSSQSNRDAILKEMQEMGVDQETINGMQAKYTSGVALTSKEMDVQAATLKSLLAKMSTNQDLASTVSRGFLKYGELVAVSGDARAMDTGNVKERSRELAQKIVDEYEAGLVEAAQINSPSKRTRKRGKETVDGFDEGLKEGKGKARKAGADLANEVAAGAAGASAGTTRTRDSKGRFTKASTAPTPTDVATLAAIGGASMNSRLADEQEQLANTTKKSKLSFLGLNNAISNSLFAVTSLAGALTLVEGPVGEVANSIFQLSGIVFALAQVTQLLTSAKLTELAASRLAIAKQAVAFATYGKGIAAGTGFIGMLARGALFVARFIGPIGIAITALTALAGIIGLIIGEQEKAKQKIEGLGNVAAMSAEKIAKLGGLVGATARPTPLQGAKPIMSATGGLTTEKRSATQQILSDESFKTDFATEIAAIKAAGTAQAELVLKSLAMNLAGQGFAQDQVEAIINALVTEAGRTDVKLDFKSLDLNLAVNRAKFNSQIDTELKNFKTAYETGMKEISGFEIVKNPRPGKLFEWVVKEVPTEELKAEADTLGSVFASTFNALSGQFENGIIDATAFNAEFLALENRLKSLKDEEALLLMQSTLSTMNPELATAVGKLTDMKDIMELMRAASLGIAPTTTELELITAGSAPGASVQDIAAKNAALQQIRMRYEDLKNVIQEVNTIEEEALTPDQEYEEAMGSFDEMVGELREQKSVYDDLVDAGMSHEEALAAVKDETIRAAAAAAIATGNYDDFKKKLDEFNNLTDALSTDTGGSGEKSPFQKGIEALQDQRKELKDTSTAYNKLRKAGIGIASAFEAAKDPVLAAALASTKVGTANWKKLLGLIKEVDAAARKSKLTDIIREQAGVNKLNSSFAKIIPNLRTMGVSAEDIRDILNDPDLAQSFVSGIKNGKLQASQLKTIIDQLAIKRKIQLEIDLSMPGGATAEFNKIYGKAQAYFDSQEAAVNRTYDSQIKGAEAAIETAQDAVDSIQSEIDGIQTQIDQKQRDIEVNITRKIEGLQEQISDTQRAIELEFDRPIETLQEESSDLSNELELIDRAADKINEKYDKQIDALDKQVDLAKKANDEASKRLDITNALAEGDIAAAAKAAQELQGDSVEEYANRIRAGLESARQTELSGLRSSTGMTREQIEERQFEISQQIFKLEEKREEVQLRIRDIQDEIYGLEELREEKQREIVPLEDKLYEIENGRMKSAQATLKAAEDYLKTVQDNKAKALEPINAQRDAWNQVNEKIQAAAVAALNLPAMLAQANKLVGMEASASATDDGTIQLPDNTNPNQAKIDELNRLIQISRWRVNEQQGLSATAKQNLIDMNIDRIKEVRKLGGEANMTGMIKPTGMASGGLVKPKYFNVGGFARGTDTVPAMLTPGEFVVRKYAVDNFGVDKLKSINSGTYSGDSMYNYEINVNVRSDANAQDIARTVISQIKSIDSQRIRGNRL